MRVGLYVPPDVQIGENFQVRIDLDASAANGDLMLTIVYDKTRLAFSNSSQGDYSRTLGARMEVEEPSDGNIQVILRSGNGSAVTGVGGLIVLQFEAINAGVAAITLQNLMTIDSGGATDTNIAVPGEGAVTVH
jgi:hypothetical protein